jgi:hypothetical protein
MKKEEKVEKERFNEDVSVKGKVIDEMEEGKNGLKKGLIKERPMSSYNKIRENPENGDRETKKSQRKESKSIITKDILDKLNQINGDIPMISES